jgi:tetrapyrrole methylase family protein / MazG family protein
VARPGARPSIVVVGLGPGGPDLVTGGTLDEIARVPHRFLRTGVHPASSVLPDAPTFDHYYERADRFDDVYAAIVEDLVAAAAEHGEVIYAVPGSPRVLERSVDRLTGDPRVAVRVVPAMSFLDLAWIRLGVDPVEAGVRLVDGHRFAEEAAAQRGPLLVAHCHNQRVLSDVKLAYDDAPPPTVVALQRLGLADERIVEVAWEELDRAVDADHLTSLWIPATASDTGGAVVGFHEVVRTLRAECPWDRQQTHASLSRHLLEESYEVLEALDHLDVESAEGFEELEEELGDLLFQVVFHAVLAEEEGQFTLADVARSISDKLRDRHPHVFGDASVESLEQLSTDWERRKVEEKGRASVMDGIPAALPALLLALKVQKKAASQDVDWRGLVPAAELGDLARRLLDVVDDARASGLDPESELRAATVRLREAYRARE